MADLGFLGGGGSVLSDCIGKGYLKKQGKADERAGKAKGFVADVKDKADNVVDTVKEKVTKH